jgi:hypothetical protein
MCVYFGANAAKIFENISRFFRSSFMYSMLYAYVCAGSALEARDAHVSAQPPLAPAAKVALVALLALGAVRPVGPDVARRALRASEAGRAGPAQEALVARADAPFLAGQAPLAHLHTITQCTFSLIKGQNAGFQKRRSWPLPFRRNWLQPPSLSSTGS